MFSAQVKSVKTSCEMHKLTPALWFLPWPAAIHQAGSLAAATVLFEAFVAGDCDDVSSLCPWSIHSAILRHSRHPTPTAEGRHLSLIKRWSVCVLVYMTHTNLYSHTEEHFFGELRRGIKIHHGKKKHVSRSLLWLLLISVTQLSIPVQFSSWYWKLEWYCNWNGVNRLNIP